MKIAFDAGHGLHTPGKRTPNDEREWTFNNKVAQAFEDEMNKYVDVQLLRTDDRSGKTDAPLAARTNQANGWKADIYISFHHNANTGKWGSWTGVETFVYTSASKTSLALANTVHPAVVKAYGLRDRGVRQKNLHIVRETNMPAILIEGGFMDSTIDIKKLRDENVLKNAGKLIAQAVANLYKLKRKEEENVKKDDIAGHWAEKSLRKSKEKKVIVGDASGAMKPNDPVTRAQLAVILDRLELLE